LLSYPCVAAFNLERGGALALGGEVCAVLDLLLVSDLRNYHLSRESREGCRHIDVFFGAYSVGLKKAVL